MLGADKSRVFAATIERVLRAGLHERIAIVTRDDEAGRADADLLEKHLAKHKLRAAHTLAFDPEQPILLAAIDELVALKPTALILLDSDAGIDRLVDRVRATRRRDLCALIVAQGDGAAFAKRLGHVADAAWVPAGLPHFAERWLAIQVAYQRATKAPKLAKKRSQAEFEGYVAGRVLREVVVDRIGSGDLRTMFASALRVDPLRIDGLVFDWMRRRYYGQEQVAWRRCLKGVLEAQVDAKRVRAVSPGRD